MSTRNMHAPGGTVCVYLLQTPAPPPPAAITNPSPQMPVFSSMPLEDRQCVLEGLMRVVTLLAPPEALECALGLQAPLMARIQAILTHGSSMAAQGGPAAKQLLKHLAQELQLMAVLVKGMEVPGAPPVGGAMHPAMRLLEVAWPALTAVGDAPVCQQDAAVVQALCEVHKVSMVWGWGAAKPHACGLYRLCHVSSSCGHACAGLSGQGLHYLTCGQHLWLLRGQFVMLEQGAACLHARRPGHKGLPPLVLGWVNGVFMSAPAAATCQETDYRGWLSAQARTCVAKLIGLVAAACVCGATVVQRAVQTARGGAKPLLATLLKAVGDLFVATQQAAPLELLATITEVFGEVKGAPEVAAAQQQALEGEGGLRGLSGVQSCVGACVPDARNLLLARGLAHAQLQQRCECWHSMCMSSAAPMAHFLAQPAHRGTVWTALISCKPVGFGVSFHVSVLLPVACCLGMVLQVLWHR